MAAVAPRIAAVRMVGALEARLGAVLLAVAVRSVVADPLAAAVRQGDGNEKALESCLNGKVARVADALWGSITSDYRGSPRG